MNVEPGADRVEHQEHAAADDCSSIASCCRPMMRPTVPTGVLSLLGTEVHSVPLPSSLLETATTFEPSADEATEVLPSLGPRAVQVTPWSKEV